MQKAYRGKSVKHNIKLTLYANSSSMIFHTIMPAYKLQQQKLKTAGVVGAKNPVFEAQEFER